MRSLVFKSFVFAKAAGSRCSWRQKALATERTEGPARTHVALGCTRTGRLRLASSAFKSFPFGKLQNVSIQESTRSRGGSPGASSMAKRGTNEGSIFQRKDGRWVGSLNLGWEDGKRKRRHFYAATAAEVRDELLKARSDQSRGLPVSVERQTVKEFLDHWLAESVKSSVRPATYQQYHQHVRLYLGPSLGRHRLSKLSPPHVQTF